MQLTQGPLDYSQMSEYTRCKRRFYYIYRRGLKKKVGAAASWSKFLIHEPLSGWWLSAGAASVDWDHLYGRFLTELDNQPDEYYTLALAQLAYGNYIKRFGDDFKDYEVISSERMRAIQGFPTPGFITKPDLVLLRKRDEIILVKDFKASKWSKILVDFDRQFLGQVMGYGAGGFSIDACRISNTQKGMKAEWFRDEQEVRSDLLVEWHNETASEMADIRRREESGIWTKSAPDACTEYGDRHICPFKYICDAGEFKEQLIEAAEKKEDPFDYQKG